MEPRRSVALRAEASFASATAERLGEERALPCRSVSARAGGDRPVIRTFGAVFIRLDRRRGSPRGYADDDLLV